MRSEPKQVVSFKTDGKGKGGIFAKAESMGITVSELMNYIVAYFFEKDEREEMAVLNEHMTRAGILGVALRRYVAQMNIKMHQIKSVPDRKNKEAELEQLFKLIATARNYIKENYSIDDLYSTA